VNPSFRKSGSIYLYKSSGCAGKLYKISECKTTLFVIQGVPITDSEVMETRSKHGGQTINALKILVPKVKGREHWERGGVDGRTI
jgi:hypothetical protein